MKEGTSSIVIDLAAHDDRVSKVIFYSLLLDSKITIIFHMQASLIKSLSLKKMAKSPFVSVSQKLKFIRFANIINENLYHDLRILFSIRNAYAHQLAGNKAVAEAFLTIPKLKDYSKFKDILADNTLDDMGKLFEITGYYLDKLDESSKRLNTR